MKASFITAHTGAEDPERQRSVFSFCMRDEHGSVQVICWNEAAEHFSEVVTEGQMVIVDGASVKSRNPSSPANSTTSSFELHVDSKDRASVVPYEEQPSFQVRRPLDASFITLNELSAYIGGTVLGMVYEAGMPEGGISKAGKAYQKRCILIGDHTASGVRVTFYDKDSDKAQAMDPTNTDIPQAQSLWRWVHENEPAPPLPGAPKFQGGPGLGGSSVNTDEYFSVERIRSLDIQPEEVVGCTCAGSLSKINLSASEGVWRSCTSCRAKGDGDMCSKCGAAVHTSYRLRVSLMDNTGTLDLCLFGERAAALLGGMDVNMFMALDDAARLALEQR